VIDSVFLGNQAPALGPDVGGGAIYALGSLGVVVQGSTFTNNSGSDSGAIGALNSDLEVVNSTFSGNKALGNGGNTIDTTMCSVGGGEVGNGGNAGAIGIDGGDDGDDTFCGDTFTGNQANELGGVLGRTPDVAQQTTTFNLCTFAGNQAKNGGALYLHNSDLVITGSTFSANTATGSGAIQADDTTFDFTNVTFAGNTATSGLGGALALFGNGGTIVNCTFADNTSPGGSGLFAAAIAGGTAMTIRNTIFADNTTMDCGSPMACQDGASTGDGNIQWPMVHTVCATADTPCTPSTVFADALLGPLQNNGGTTETQIPAAGSPALGVGVNCPATDQRGMPRPQTGCAAGAVEP
jgi:predicted outer membrane repeat protein